MAAALSLALSLAPAGPAAAQSSVAPAGAQSSVAPAGAQSNVALRGLQADRSAPVEIEADTLTVSQSGNTATFEGNVLVVQGTLRLSATTVHVDYTEAAEGVDGGIARVTADGDVLLATEADAARARHAVYDVPAGIITMTGDVLLTQGRTVVSGEALVVDLDANTGTMKGRVRTVLQPDPAR